jgi:hypothetical protein
MKKQILLILIASVLSTSVLAQNQEPPVSTDKKNRQEKMRNSSSEGGDRMEKMHKMIDSLPEEKRQAAKGEMKRHREEMGKIVGKENMPHRENKGGRNMRDDGQANN